MDKMTLWHLTGGSFISAVHISRSLVDVSCHRRLSRDFTLSPPWGFVASGSEFVADLARRIFGVHSKGSVLAGINGSEKCGDVVNICSAFLGGNSFGLRK